MGVQNAATRQYMENRDIFADLCNYYIYDGKPVVQPEQLRPLDGTELTILEQRNGNLKEKLKQRDLLMSVSAMTDETTAYMIVGVENQSKVHYAMPVRNMLYDASRYNQQVRMLSKELTTNQADSSSAAFLSGGSKNIKLLPLVTLVVYFGTDPWDGPRSLHEMLHVEHEEILQYAADYKLQLIAPYHLSDEDLEKFQSNLKEVLSFIKYEKDKDKISDLMQRDAFKALDKDAAMVLNTCTRLKLPIEDYEEMGEVNMCQAWEEIKEDCRIEGRQEGRWESRKELAAQLMKDNIYPLSRISELTELPMAELEALQQTV